MPIAHGAASRTPEVPSRTGPTAFAALAIALVSLGSLASGAALADRQARAAGALPGGFDAELGALYEATALNPFDAVGANNLAMKLVARGDYEKARKLLRRAERLDPSRLEFTRNAEQVQRLIDQREELPSRSRAHFRDSFAAVEVPFVGGAWVVSGPGRIGVPSEEESGERRTAGTAPDTTGTGAPAAGASGTGAARADAGLDGEGGETLAENPFDTRWLRERAAIKVRRGDYRAALVDLRRALVLDPYLSGVSREIERLRELLPEGGERPVSRAAPRTGSRVSPGGGALDEEGDGPPAPWDRAEGGA